jgi:hypothetical protein
MARAMVAPEVVAWSSACCSIQGMVRNAVASAGRAAEVGRIESWPHDAAQGRAAAHRDWRTARGAKSAEKG